MEKKLVCLECNKAVANSANILSRHIKTQHSMQWVDYVIKYDHDGVWPTCACGCGEKLVWRKGGFGKYAKGHDGRMTQQADSVKVAEKLELGWCVNPFTGREEHLSNDDLVALLQHCIDNDDPVTHDHGLRIGWEDASGKFHISVPSFRHLKKRLIITIDNPIDTEFRRRMAGYKEWCKMHRFILLVLKRTGNNFDVVGGFKPEADTDETI